MRRLHVVVFDLQVRAQHQAGLPAHGNAAQALVHVGFVRARGNVRVGVDHCMRLAAGQHQRFGGTAGVGRLVGGVYLLLQLVVGRQQQPPDVCVCVRSCQAHCSALQVVPAASGDQRLLVARVRAQLHLQVVRQLVVRARADQTQVLQHSAFAQLHLHLQVLRQAGVGGNSAARVRFQQHAMGAVRHVQHQ